MQVQPAAPAKRVLIADDNRDWADGLALLLGDHGYGVLTAYDGREAIEAARAFEPHIVLVDIHMPGQTGYEVARAFGQHPGRSRPVMIAVTAWPAESLKLRSEMMGFDHFLSKAAAPAEILELLKKV